ncbi:MAG TPA: lipopolysaccharide kinase InaA family protein [Syntrophales bacterium]|jgi:tRNA A-37 threonylcarbamoyl transferase component Bud32|nr:lipopolysaccharide kinase InaA family protein [Syntrophales bacterium]
MIHFFPVARNAGTILKLGNFCIHCDPHTPEAAFFRDFTADPDSFFDRGEPIRSAWKSRIIDKAKVQMEGQSFFIKRYNCLGKMYQLKNLARKSKALKAWLAGRQLLQSGISTPNPVICMEEYRFGLLERSYLCCDFIQGARNLLDLWPELDHEERMGLLGLAGIETGNLHRLGCLHGDLNWRNVLVRGKDDGGKIFLVDLDGCRFSRHLGEKSARRDLRHFYRDLDRNHASAGYIDHFTDSWYKTFHRGTAPP